MVFISNCKETCDLMQSTKLAKKQHLETINPISPWLNTDKLQTHYDKDNYLMEQINHMIHAWLVSYS